MDLFSAKSCVQNAQIRFQKLTIKALNHQVQRGENGRGRAQPLQRETGEGIDDDVGAGGDEHDSDYAQRRVARERRAKLPVGNPPGHRTCDAAGSENEKQRASQKREVAADGILRWRRGFRGHGNCAASLPHFSSSA